ncbi:MAG: hypothetical protein HQL11_02755 [Candidatus Omnitrophica bacterium]|nr:hypothetical protein [Candidatus Omnitrophota bacterium]
MIYEDYFSEEIQLSRTTPSLASGTGAGAVSGAANGARSFNTVTVATVNPLIASMSVGVVWGGIVSLLNVRRYKKGQITKRDAVLDSAGETVGMSIASGVGLLLSNAVRTSFFALSSTSAVPFTVGVVVTLGVKAMWNCSTKRHLKCPAPASPKKAAIAAA